VLSRAQKEEQVVELREKFGRATGLFLADYRGLKVDEVNELRRKLREEEESQPEYRVAKNAMLKLAAAGTDCESIAELCEGPTALAIAYGYPVALAKTLVDFAKQHEVFELKGGILDGSPLDSAAVAKLATLPSLTEIRAQMVGLIQAPATKLVRLLNEPAGQLARLVEARRGALEEGGDA
jgi:large subunit ribosomal protein L10